MAADLKKAVSKFVKQTYAKPVRIIVTGHSLGGALAQLAAADLAGWFPKQAVSVYTFASPRVGDADFCGHLVGATADCHNLVNRGDPVPFVPPVGPNVLKKKDKKYVTAETVHYLRSRGKIVNKLPLKLASNPLKHRSSAYQKAIEAVIEAKDNDKNNRQFKTSMDPFPAGAP